MSENHPQVTHGVVEATATEAEVPGVEAARSALMAELCGLGSTLCAAMEAQPGFVPCGHAFGELIGGLNAAVVSDDEGELAQAADQARARSEHVSAHRGVAQGAAEVPSLADPMAALLWAALRGVSADAWRAMRLARMSDEVNVFLAAALAALGTGAVDHALLLRAGAAAKAALELAA